MALRATIGADFSELTHALDAAQGRIKETLKGAGDYASYASKQFVTLSNSFNGGQIIAQASAAARAVESIGGAAKLTEAEQRRVNAIVGEAIAKYKALGQEAPADLKKVYDATTPIPKATDAITASVGKADTALAAIGKSAAGYLAGMATWDTVRRVVGGTVDFLKESVQAAADAEASQKRLETAMRQNGVATEGNRQAFEALAIEMQRTTVYEDDQIVALEAMATQLGVLPSQMEPAIKAAANLASGLGIDLESAMRMIVKANAESFTAFQKLGISIDTTKAKAEGLPYVLDQINKGLGGQAAAEVETYAGRIKQLSNEWGNLKEALGGLILSHGLLADSFRGLTDLLRGATLALTKWNAALVALEAMAMRGGILGLVNALEKLGQIPPPKFDASKVSDEAMAAAKAAEQAEEEREKKYKGITERLTKAYQDEANARVDAFKKMKAAEDEMSGAALITRANELVATYQRVVAQGLTPTEEQQRELNDAVAAALPIYERLGREAPEALRRTEEATRRLATTPLALPQLSTLPTGLPSGIYDDYVNGVIRATDITDQFGRTLTTLPTVVTGVRDEIGAFVDTLGLVRDQTGQVIGYFDKLTGEFIDLGKAAKTGSQSFGSIFTDTLRGIPDLLKAALTGGGGLGGAIQGIFSDLGSKLGTKFASMIGNSLGKTLGSVFSSLLPGVGAFLGPAIDWLGNKLFKTEGKKVNDLRDAFISAAGGLDALNKKAHDAGLTLDRLLRAKTVKEYEAAVAELNTALEQTATLQGELATLQQQLADRQVLDWQKAEELITKYGGTLGNLGQQFIDAKQAANWKDIWDDWQTLIDMGADVGGVLVSMKDEIGKLVGESMRIGTEIPAQFKPLIEELIRTGQLFDENGNAITDIAQLKFGAPLVSEVDKIIAAIQKLVDALNRNLTPAINSIPDQVTVDVGYNYEPFRPPTENAEAPESYPSYREGTGGFVDFGKGTLAVLHGREAVVPEDQVGKAFPAVSGPMAGLSEAALAPLGSITQALTAALNKGGADAQATIRDLLTQADQVAKATLGAIEPVGQALGTTFSNGSKQATDALSVMRETVTGTAGAVLGDLLERIVPIGGAIAAGFGEGGAKASDALTAIRTQVTETQNEALTKIAPVAGAITDVFRTMQDEGSSSVEQLRAQLDGLSQTQIPPIEVPIEWTYEPPEPGGFTGGQLPAYASGALITTPQVAQVGEGGEPELIGPISFMREALAGALPSVMTPKNSVQDPHVRDQTIRVPINLDGRQITEVIIRRLSNRLSVSGVQVKY